MKSAISLILITSSCLKAAAFHTHQPKQTSRVDSSLCKSKPHIKLYSTTQDSEQEERKSKSKRKEEEVSRFLTDFKTAKGNLVDPYKILKLPRTASPVEIKQRYRKLSRKWHPDAVAQKEILPGKW